MNVFLFLVQLHSEHSKTYTNPPWIFHQIRHPEIKHGDFFNPKNKGTSFFNSPISAMSFLMVCRVTWIDSNGGGLLNVGWARAKIREDPIATLHVIILCFKAFRWQKQCLNHLCVKIDENCRVFVEVPEFPLASHSQKSCNDKQVRCLRCHCIFYQYCQTPFTRIHNLVPLTSENQNKKTVLPSPSAFSRFQRLQNGSPMWPNNFPCEPCSHGSCGRSVCSWPGHEDFDIQSRIRQHRSNRSDRCRWSWRESRHPTKKMQWFTKWRSENKGSVLNLWAKSNKKMNCLVSKFSWSPLSRPRLLSIL